ncbi:hypothetical protein MANES_15G157700v8 [Manihot esculenta]|uniref:Uncharacterized protein n=1 Tax=Manihot esculenta TaxID=3983 RepID=A0ACB7GBQ7_MANES|nr:hypothetical protein MANES_15G157700v8 [Manihot esculenta]
MGKLGHDTKHHLSSKLVFLLFCVGLLGVVFIADVVWTSSSSISSAYQSVAFNWALQTSGKVLFVNATDKKDNEKEAPRGKKHHPAYKFLPATYADLPAPELEWEQMPSAPVPRLDGYAIQIKNLLYAFAGYGTLDYVHSHIDVYNFTDDTWGERFDIPKDMAHSHLGIATDGRYIYIVSGQYGPQCRTAITKSFSLDTETKKWRSMPPLPAPRYAPATQIWRGRLHVMGGSKENRHTPGVDHWSIAVKDGEAIEKEWRTEVPIPRGGPHSY